MSRPRICSATICRNEQRDLPKMLASLAGVVDHVVIVDTGSTDKTKIAAVVNSPAPLTFETYLDASEPDPERPGEYRIANFAKARNRSLELAEATGCDYVLWIDADDVVETPRAFRRASYLPRSIFGTWIYLDKSGLRQLHHRMYPAEWKLRFTGWVHEYLVMPDERSVVVLQDACIRHDSTPHATSGEDSNQRNLRILTAEFAAAPNARTAFYLANTHKDGGRPAEAIPWYHKRLAFGDAFRDEYAFAALYLARSFRMAGNLPAAIDAAEFGAAHFPDWQEFRMEIAHGYYWRKDYARAIDEASKAIKQPQPLTMLWREPQMYGDQPARLISWCHEHLGNIDQAIVWAELAAELIGNPDHDWDVRRMRLRSIRMASIGPGAPAIVKRERQLIALNRPGAIGDIIMTLNLLPAFREQNPDADIHYFCSKQYADPEQLGMLILQAGADAVLDSAGLPAWRKTYDRVIDLVGYPIAEGYPHKRMARHLLQYFADEMGVNLMNGLPQLTLPRPAKPTWAEWPYVTVQQVAGWSKYKEWPSIRWNGVGKRLDELGIRPHFYAIHQEKTPTLREAIALFANADLHVGIDSFANHLTNYLWRHDYGIRRVPGVILWGSTQWDAAGYLDNTNLSMGLPCQPCFRETVPFSAHPLPPCPNTTPEGLHKCMDAIDVDRVVNAIATAWAKR